MWIADLTGQECYFGGFCVDAFPGGEAGCVCVCAGAPPEIEGSSIVLREPKNRKRMITASPSRIPSTIPIARSRIRAVVQLTPSSSRQLATKADSAAATSASSSSGVIACSISLRDSPA